MTDAAWIVPPVRPGDDAAIIALWQACGLVVPHNDPQADLDLARGKSNSDVLVATDAGDRSLVGAVMVGHDGHRGWIYYLASDPARRNRGIGRTLVHAAELWLKQRSIPKLQLMVRNTNLPVLAFYDRIGFDTVPHAVLQKWLTLPIR